MIGSEQPTAVKIEAGTLIVTLSDQRVISTPLDWYPFLKAATPEQRENIRLKPNAIWWNDLEEGLSVEGMLLGVNPHEEQEHLAHGTDKSYSLEALTE